MKLQVAFDIIDLEKALTVARSIDPYVDIFEIGTLLIYKYGIGAIEKFQDAFPQKTILADAKILDRSKEAVILFGQAGADLITVMAGATSNVIHTASAVANVMSKKIVLDLADASSLGQSALDAKNLGIEYLLLHKTSSETDNLQFIDKWEMVKGNTTLPIFISANITRATIADILSLSPSGVVIGSAITDAADPKQEASYFSEVIRNR